MVTFVNKATFKLDSLEPPRDFAHADESYELSVSREGVSISARNSFGAARALATLVQLARPRGFSISSPEYRIPQALVEDRPRYPYRAVMVDTARHFLPLSTLKRQISALSVAKLSVLHLHVPDSQSFPLKTETAPGSAFSRGCWKKNGVEYVQTLEELKSLGQWAKDLGVFVMVEFDMPGHAASWGKADPGLVCRCGDVVSPASPEIYKYIKSFIKDVFSALYAPFGFTPMIHLGGDEVNSGCFGGDPAVSKLMREHGWSHRELWQDFHAKVAKIVREVSRELYPDRDGAQFRFYWQESFSNGNDLSDGGVVHAWMNTHEMTRAADRGYFVVRSQGWYLDINQPGRSRDAFQDSWIDFYELKLAGSMNAAQRKFLLGGGGCQWGEKVHNFNIDE